MQCFNYSVLKFILFADDTQFVFYSGVDIQTICECISRELDKLHVWLSVNKLSLNVDKTNFVLFGNRKNIDNVCISMNNSIVTTIGEACVCVCAKFDQFLPVRPHFDTKRPVNFFHIATFPSPTFGPLFAFHCPLFFTKNNNLHAAMF